jgi:hypothetical protein
VNVRQETLKYSACPYVLRLFPLFRISSGEQSWQIIRHLKDRRLVVTGRDAQGCEMAEVVHEALIQKWGRFQEWMDSDRAFRAWQVAWSPDGTRLVGASLLKSVEIHRVWQSTQELIDYAKECCVIRELTEAERTQFGLK